MTVNHADLEQECRVFTRFISRVEPSPYVTRKYVDAHRLGPDLAPADLFDGWLVAVARSSPPLTRLADAYARHFAPRTTLRRKLVLLLAILESSPPFNRVIDRVPARPFVIAVLALAVTGLGGLAAALAGAALFAPIRFLSRGRRGRT
jgi:hypothetical protein